MVFGFSNWPRLTMLPRYQMRWLTVLGITQQPGKSVKESVAAALEGRVRLLLFDNCEHVLDGAADLIEVILGQSSGVRILATSREGLGVVDEQTWPVRSLDVEAAAELFIERAHSVAPAFTVDDADASWRSAVGSTESAWRSSWRRHGCHR